MIRMRTREHRQLEHEGVARRDAYGGDPAHRQHRREIPGDDAGEDAHGLAGTRGIVALRAVEAGGALQ